MRIQHNIAALNSYRNLTGNNSAVSKNLEKLSSGYRINRAGDDAAGLAISEKMRAQITGLETAQKNANDGISLVQTAEGALTEVHSMLNRMVELAQQSANGTYQDAVDRENLQKEMTSLKDEIDRISEATNFNGINLLDGSLSGTGSTKAVTGSFDSIKGALAAGVTDVDAIKASSTLTMAEMANGKTWAGGEKINFSIGLSDGTSMTIELTAKVDATTKVTTLSSADGSFTYEIAAKTPNTAAGDVAGADVNKALAAYINQSDLGKTYTASVNTGGAELTLEAKEAGSQGATITSIGQTVVDKSNATLVASDKDVKFKAAPTKGADAYQALNLDEAVIYDGTNLDKATFEINGEKFVFVNHGAVDDTTLAAMKEAGITHYVETAAAGDIVNTDVASMAEKIQLATGLKVETGAVSNSAWSVSGTATDNVYIKLGDGVAKSATGGLTLQIGDTSDDFNQLNVSVSSMDTKSLGIAGVDVSTQAGAKAAVSIIKDAINSVSSTRGDLGAIQNRLEHTINNLSVTTENMTSAESRIRDVDMAQEMMAYTKNNILVQASQAMLAQANQIPQGVLQLLQ